MAAGARIVRIFADEANIGHGRVVIPSFCRGNGVLGLGEELLGCF
jgi:hypothetical protein